MWHSSLTVAWPTYTQLVRRGISGSASFPGTKKSWVLGASIPRVAGENMGWILGPEEPMFVAARRASIYDFLAGAAAVTL